MAHGRGIILTFALALSAITASSAFAQPARSGVTGDRLPSMASSANESETREAKAARSIDQLIVGRLSPEIEAASLFAASLRAGEVAIVKSVIAMTADRALFERALKNPSVLAPLSGDQARLAVAQARFLRLPQQRRQALLASHAAAAAELKERAEASAREERQLERLRGQVLQLEAFLAGKSARQGTLGLDLLSEFGGLAAQTVDEDRGDPESEVGLRQRLAQLRRQILALPMDRLVALEKASGIGSTAEATAQIAEDQLESARREAAKAENERDRLLAGERAKLLAARAAQARASADLIQRKVIPDEIQEEALTWRRRVQEVAEGARDIRASRADALYQLLVAHLQDIRHRLRLALSGSAARLDPRIVPSGPDEAIAGGLVSDAGLGDLRRELAQGVADLRARQAAAASVEQKALRDAMVLINDARLELIPYLSTETRSAVLGFGGEGIAQVSRELSQISLDARYHAANWRRNLDAAIAPFRRPTPSMVFSLVGFVLLTLLFRWWRHHGDAVLTASERALRERRPRTLVSETQANLLSFVRRVGAPIDWLAYILLLRWLMPDEPHPTGLSFIWIFVTYSLAAWLMAGVTNELARGRRRIDPRADLRLKSLSMVVGVSFVVLLVLAMARESVGKGAIYNWVLSFCWLLAIPVVLTLSHWWRERIVVLAGVSAEKSGIFAWIARDPGGLLGLFGRVFAGALLLIDGARVVIARRMRDFVLVREIFEHRERTQAALRVAEDKASGKYQRIPDAAMDLLDPHRAPAHALRIGESRSGSEMDWLPGGTIGALIGERGLGKSAVLCGLAEVRRQRGEEVVAVQVDHRGFAGVLADLVLALHSGKMRVSEENLAETLRGRAQAAPLTLFIDDLQRLIVPAIGGLDELDRLIALARQSGNRCTWFMAIGAPAWNYVSRARFDRVLFDKVDFLPRWSLDELQALIDRRTAQVGLIPDFSDLSDMGAYQFEGELTPEQRRQAAYFDRLSDYANGNPAVALEFWRRSLFTDATSGKTVVRTFATPDASQLAALPPAATFVLRAILQMEYATQAAIERSTDLAPVIVSDAIRGLERLGVIAPFGEGYRITLFWWAEVIRVLQRQNLIVRS